MIKLALMLLVIVVIYVWFWELAKIVAFVCVAFSATWFVAFYLVSLINRSTFLLGMHLTPPGTKSSGL
jgi:hypothetical protein